MPLNFRIRVHGPSAWRNDGRRTGSAPTVLSHFSNYIESHYPQKPVTIGNGNLEGMRTDAPEVNVLSLHVYKPAEQTKEEIVQAKDFARRANKPLLITEFLANTNQWLTILLIRNWPAMKASCVIIKKSCPF